MYITADTYYLSNEAHDDLATKTALTEGAEEKASVNTVTPATPDPDPAG